MNETSFKRMKNLPSAHILGTGTPMCAGCGGLLALHEIYDILGEKTVFLNAAGCMTLLAVYPFTPFRGSMRPTNKMFTLPSLSPSIGDTSGQKCSESMPLGIIV